MLKYLKNTDPFFRNILIVFTGTILINVFNLLCQLLIAHRLEAVDFAAFNSLLSIFVVLSTPLTTLQTVAARYIAGFNARGEVNKVKFLLTALFRKIFFLSLVTFIIFYFVSFSLLDKLKINCVSCGYILAFLLALSWINPVLGGGIQGLELFKWMFVLSLTGGLLKLFFAFIFLESGFGISGALGAFLASFVIASIVAVFALRKYISFKLNPEELPWREFFIYFFPVAISIFCFTALTNMDMVLVRYYFAPLESGSYSLAQMVGKIFLFLPAAISLVMFPKVSGLNANQLSSTPILKRSLLYAAILCVLAGLFYNTLPSFTLKILTGKAFPESIALGRLFSISMSFYALSFIIISYFLSIKDLRFLKYLVMFSCFQALAIIFLHRSLFQVQLILCITAVITFLLYLIMAGSKQK